jgi:hypothetical protein
LLKKIRGAKLLMIPVEVTQSTWHYSTPLDFLDHWQILLGGGAALIAALLTIGVTLQSERRQAKQELDALRKSLAVEIRLHLSRALGT